MVTTKDSQLITEGIEFASNIIQESEEDKYSLGCLPVPVKGL